MSDPTADAHSASLERSFDMAVRAFLRERTYLQAQWLHECAIALMVDDHARMREAVAQRAGKAAQSAAESQIPIPDAQKAIARWRPTGGALKAKSYLEQLFPKLGKSTR